MIVDSKVNVRFQPGTQSKRPISAGVVNLAVRMRPGPEYCI